MGIFDAILGVLKPIAGAIFPNPEDQLKKMELENNLQIQVMNNATQLQLAAADCVKTEAASTHWLASCWRPLVMLVFTALIVARFMGWSAPGIPEAEYMELWGIVKLGIGGYMTLRTGEKLAPPVIDAFTKILKK